MRRSDGSFEDLQQARKDLIAGFDAFFQRLCQIAAISGCFESPALQPVRVPKPGPSKPQR